MPIGVRAHDYGRSTPQQLAQTLHRCGYDCTQLTVPKAIAGIDGFADITPRHLEEIREAFTANQVEITVFGCYMDLSDPDKEVRAAAVETLKKGLAFGKAVNAKVVGTETSCAWLDAGEKRRRRPWMLDSILRGMEEAARLDMKLAIEPVRFHPLDSVEAVQELYEAVGDDEHLRLIFDPCGLLEDLDPVDQDAVWTQWLQTVGEKIVAVHMKDLRLDDAGERIGVPLGSGVLRYDTISRWLRENRPDMPLLREEMVPANAAADIAFLKGMLEG